MAGEFVKASILFLLFGVVSSSVSRKVNTTPWPGCEKSEICRQANKTGNLPHVVYTKASAKNHDNLHYVFSTKDFVTVLMARTTGADTDMVFEWDILLSNHSSLMDGLSFTDPKKIHVTFRYGVSFVKLIEYDDTSDNANLVDWENSKDKKKKLNIRPFSNFTWEPLDLGGLSKNEFVFKTTDDEMVPEKSNNGSLSFSFHVPAKEGRESALPAQKYTANETIFEFLLDKYTPRFKNSRFALEAVAVSLETKKMEVDTVKTIDDEFSPGVFLLTNWLSNPSDVSESGFVQWKPVAYFGSSRSRMTVTKTKHYDLYNLDEKEDEMLNATLLSALFGNDMFGESADIKKMNISFGEEKDGFYLKKNYTVWNGAIGYGDPPKDEISMTVIIIIATGLGIPVLLCIVGGIYTIQRAVRKKKSQYEAINGHSSVDSNRPQVNE